MSPLTLITPLPFPLELKGGTRLTLVGDVVVYLTRLSDTQQEAHYWKLAIRMFNIAVSEPTYLRTATMCFQTALLMDQLLADPHTVTNR